MDYEKFLQGIAWTKRQWEQREPCPEPKCEKYQCFSYAALRKRGNGYWLHLEHMSESDLTREIIYCFLNTQKWFCHLDEPDTAPGKEMVSNLKKAVCKLSSYYASLSSLTIAEIDFQSAVGHEGREKPILLIIDEIYSIFRQIKPRFGPVPASKLMHMALPNLFIMWDRAIFNEYSVPRQDLIDFVERRALSYTAFLILMQENIHHVKETNPGGSSVTYPELFRQINKQCGYMNLPITRLLDIANYAIAHPEKGAPNIKCKRCCERTNHRLDNELKWYATAVNLGRYRC